MAYTLGNKCAKNLCKRIVLLQLIIENVVTCFFGTQCSYGSWHAYEKKNITKSGEDLETGTDTLCMEWRPMKQSTDTVR